ncbi:hypothetical protein AB6A40_002878 [Gnathostoma spinigerum]|uniref:Protein SET n=1 Tax=Gnathostoma spinigerum TaxID=75299 RepID=A0ABD6E7V6_9BILA
MGEPAIKRTKVDGATNGEEPRKTQQSANVEPPSSLAESKRAQNTDSGSVESKSHNSWDQKSSMLKQKDLMEYDGSTQKILEQMDRIQGEIDKLNENASEEILKVEQKYNTLRKPFFEKRNELVQNIPNFWVTAFVNHPNISAILDEEEEECLHYLSKVEVEEFDDIKSGYRIKLIFDENPFFENTQIVKEFFLGNAEPTSMTSEINWKPDNELAAKIRAKAEMRGDYSPSQRRSFFGWLIDNEDPSSDEIAELIKDDLWPNPLQYFLIPDCDLDIDESGEGALDEEAGSEAEGEENVDDLEEADDAGDDGEEGEDGEDGEEPEE